MSRSIVTNLLRGWGALPQSVGSGTEALEALDQARRAGVPFQLILIDLHLPDVDGFRLSEQVKAGFPTGPHIILLTSAGLAGDAARCRELGIAAYLAKPIMGTDLLEAIQAVLAPDAAAAPDLVTRHSIREARHRLRLLLAEDHLVNRNMIARMLEKHGHVVTKVENGRQALDAWETGDYDIIVMDVQMPEIDGLKAASWIRERERISGRHVPILALTAHAMAGDRERCLKHGMDGYISKPVKAEALFRAIEALTVNRPSPLRGPERASLASSGLMDMEAALQHAGGDHEVLADAVSDFLTEAPRVISKIRAALDGNDATLLEQLAHGLKGALATLAARDATREVQRLEKLASERDLDAFRAAFGGFESEFDRLTASLEAFRRAA